MKWLFLSVLFASALVACAPNGNSSGANAADASAHAAGAQTDSLSEADSPTDSIEQLVEAEPVSLSADNFFSDFIYSFTTNKRFQFERIVFPLPVRSGQTITYLDRDKWYFSRLHLKQPLYTVFLDRRSSLELEKSPDLDSVTIEWFFVPEDRVRDYRFRKTEGRWMLAEISDYPLEQHADYDFINFYIRFAGDSAYQIEHVMDPIDFVMADPDEEYAEMEGVLDLDQWPSFSPDMPADVFTNIDYGQPAAHRLHRVVALEGSSNGFQCLLYFKQTDDGWMLYKMEN